MDSVRSKNMGILGHLGELRSRLLKAAASLIVASVLSFVFADKIFKILVSPAGTVQLIYIDMTEMIGVYMKVCLTAGLALAMPFVVYQILMFVFPALTSKEKNYVLLALPWIAMMFVGGAIFSYFVLMPPAVRFLLSFGSDIAVPQIRIGSYINVVTRVILAGGIVFELPVISTFLARLGIISSSWLAGRRKAAIIFAFIFAAVITPTFDPLNQTLVAVPLIVLYEVSIWLAKLVQPRISAASSAVGALSG